MKKNSAKKETDWKKWAGLLWFAAEEYLRRSVEYNDGDSEDLDKKLERMAIAGDALEKTLKEFALETGTKRKKPRKIKTTRNENEQT